MAYEFSGRHGGFRFDDPGDVYEYPGGDAPYDYPGGGDYSPGSAPIYKPPREDDLYDDYTDTDTGTDTVTTPFDPPPTDYYSNLLPWTRIFGDLGISREYIGLLEDPTTYFPDMAGYGSEFKDVGIASQRVQSLLSRLLGTGEGSLSEAERQKTELVTGAYGTGATAAEQAKTSGIDITGERFRAGQARTALGAGRAARGVRGTARKAGARAGFAGFGAVKEAEEFGIGETVRDFAESILGLTTVKSQAETDILNRFGTTMEDLERTQTAGMYNVRDVVEQMKGGGADALMALIQQYIDVRNRITARGGGDDTIKNVGGRIIKDTGNLTNRVTRRFT